MYPAPAMDVCWPEQADLQQESLSNDTSGLFVILHPCFAVEIQAGEKVTCYVWLKSMRHF